VLITVIGWAACLAAGFILQRHVTNPGRLSHVLFLVTFWVASPLVVFFAYTTLPLRVGLLAALGVTIAASWLVLALALAWGRMAGRERAERASLALATVMGNTSIVGYPLAVIAFGAPGLALAVVYSEFQFLIPPLAVSTGIARHAAGPGSHARGAPGTWALLRSWVLNPPAVAGSLALALRLAGVDLRDLVEPVGPAVGVAIGLFGFVQVGLATPLHRVALDLGRLWRAAATLSLRCGVAPLVLYLLGRITGVDIPGVFLLLAATPVAFHTIVLARVYDLDAALLRLLIVVSTPLVIGGVLIWQTL
jgi:predicted permease